jgi:hypothetical protein
LLEEFRRELLAGRAPAGVSAERWEASRREIEAEFLPAGVSWEQMAAWPEGLQVAHLSAWRPRVGRSS